MFKGGDYKYSLKIYVKGLPVEHEVFDTRNEARDFGNDYIKDLPNQSPPIEQKDSFFNIRKFQQLVPC